MGDASYRVSDAEREQAVAALREHLLAGRLTLEEFSERVETALSARVGTDLVRAQQDLPATPPPSRRKAARFTGALLGHGVRRGRLRLRHWTVAVSALADVDIDLREASIDSPQTTLTVFAVCGNADVYVPEGVNVDVSGLTVLGHHRDWGRDTATPDAPAICVRVVGLLGTVDVWRVPQGLTGDYGAIMRHLQEKPPKALE
jgi:hypothetical protein